MPDVIIKGMEMRSACGGETDCFALDESGDYPMCRITGETRGYTFPVRERRMNNCPLRPAPKGYIDGNNLFSRIAGHSYYHGDTILSAIQCAIEGKESQESIPPANVRPAPEWISVEKRLPEDEAEVLTLVKYKWAKKHYYSLDAYSQIDGGWVRNEGVTHWMPLPEPPGGGAKNAITTEEQLGGDGDA